MIRGLFYRHWPILLILIGLGGLVTIFALKIPKTTGDSTILGRHVFDDGLECVHRTYGGVDCNWEAYNRRIGQ